MGSYFSTHELTLNPQIKLKFLPKFQTSCSQSLLNEQVDTFEHNKNSNSLLKFSSNPLTSVQLKELKSLKDTGNDFRLSKNYFLAISFYKKALNIDSNNTNILFNLAQTYYDSGNLSSAIKTFEHLLILNPHDNQSRTLLGSYYDKNKEYGKALEAYEYVLKKDPKDDYANRSLIELRVKLLALEDPVAANDYVQRYASKNLKKSIEIIERNAPEYIIKALDNVNILFGFTEEVNGYDNLAQYEHLNNRILVNKKLQFADPVVIATYLVHEAVHANDKDNVSSIREEQDAFNLMITFWITVNSKDIKDPDLSLGERFYREGSLESKVRDVYQKRDVNLSETSPGHGTKSSVVSQYIKASWNNMKSMFLN